MGSDDSDDDTEEELTATRSNLKQVSEILSPVQQQQAEHRKHHAQFTQTFSDSLARQDRRGEVRFSYRALREEQERRWQHSDRKSAKEAQEKQRRRSASSASASAAPASAPQESGGGAAEAGAAEAEAQQKQLHDLPAVAKPHEMDRECASLQHRPESSCLCSC